MPVKVLTDYMELCRRTGITPTWDGLRRYAAGESTKKGATPEA